MDYQNDLPVVRAERDNCRVHNNNWNHRYINYTSQEIIYLIILI